MQEFSRSGYARLLTSFKDAGYRSVDPEAVSAGMRHIFLRHDVDYCPEYCVPLAEAEQSLGFASTFYFLVSSHFYNVMDPRVRDVFETLTQLGHSIGLHLDLAACRGPITTDDLALQEIAILERAAGQRVQSVSFHRPSQELFGTDMPVAGLPHTYQPKFVRDIAYYSDSRGRWRFGSPLESDAFKSGTAIQVLTHPVWWHSRDAETPQDRLDSWLAYARLKIEEELARNSDVFRNRNQA